MVNGGKMTEPAKKGIDDRLADGCLTPGNGWKYDPTVNGGKTKEPAKKNAHKSTKKHLRACVRACVRARARALGL
jgi:hypothetical protein